MIALLLALTVLSACQPDAPEDLPADRLWNPDAGTMIFRADYSRESLPELARISETAPCTVYGDGRVIWVNELDAFNSEVLFDIVSEAQIQTFINYMAFDENFYAQIAGAAGSLENDESPLIETILLDVGGRRHTADNYGGWDSGFFNRVLAACKSISSSPIRFEPTEAWLTVREVDAISDAASVYWIPDDHGGLSLAALADSAAQPQWVSGAGVTDIWRLLHSMSYITQYGEGERMFQIGLQAPGVTRNSPARPENTGG
ncbi:MAG: hypothetical protein IAE89_03745 [Anaerolineae bacterium]|nr:hypothetical protein [Anaerolineae bacterium]